MPREGRFLSGRTRWRGGDSNSRPRAYESPALPLSYLAAPTSIASSRPTDEDSPRPTPPATARPLASRRPGHHNAAVMTARLRSMLFVPGHRARFYERLADFRPDAVILDLEDAVPPAEKPLARSMVRERLGGALLPPFQVFVRVNAIGTPYFRDDISGVVAHGLDGIFLPKAQSSEELREANMLLA